MPRRITARMLEKARRKILKDKFSGVNADEINLKERKKHLKIPKRLLLMKIRNEPDAMIITKITRRMALERTKESKIKQISRATHPEVRETNELIDFLRTRPPRGMRKAERQRRERIARRNLELFKAIKEEKSRIERINKLARLN